MAKLLWNRFGTTLNALWLSFPLWRNKNDVTHHRLWPQLEVNDEEEDFLTASPQTRTAHPHALLWIPHQIHDASAKTQARVLCASERLASALHENSVSHPKIDAVSFMRASKLRGEDGCCCCCTSASSHPHLSLSLCVCLSSVSWEAPQDDSENKQLVASFQATQCKLFGNGARNWL